MNEQPIKILISKLSNQRNRAYDQLAQCETALEEGKIETENLRMEVDALKMQLAELAKS